MAVPYGNHRPMNTTIETEVMPPEAATKSIGVTSLALKLDEGLEPATAASLREAFESYFQQADEWRSKALTIQITRADQVREMKLARETRLALREIRINAEKTRKRLKEDSLRKGKAIDGIYNMLAFAVEPLEKHLLEQEQFVERMEAERKAKLRAERERQLEPFGVDCSLYQLGEMSDEVFSSLIETNKLAHEARIEAARKAEAERIEREAAEAAEKERLKKVAEAAESAARAEREARQRVEAELRANQEAEAKAKADAEAASRAAAAAPDRDKLAALSAAIRALPMPSLSTEAGQEIEAVIRSQTNKFAAWVDSQANKLA
jgi:hypothetical protein